MTWHSHDDQNHKQMYWDTVSSDAFRLWYGLVGECVALRQWDGILPRYVAMCATPGLLPQFETLIAELLTIHELIEDRGSEIELLQISQHIPPPGQRPDVMAPRKRANLDAHWQRKCERGEHNSHCPPDSCPVKVAKRKKPKRQPVSSPVADAEAGVETDRQPVPSGTGTGSGREDLPTPRFNVAVKGESTTAPPPCGVDVASGGLAGGGLYKPCAVCESTSGDCGCWDDPPPRVPVQVPYDPSMEPPGWG